MKRIIYLTLFVALIACKGNENKQEGNQSEPTETKMTAKEYTCPMHPEIVSDTAGVCPRCGMDLEIKS